MILLSGNPGTGKTILATQFLYNGAAVLITIPPSKTTVAATTNAPMGWELIYGIPLGFVIAVPAVAYCVARIVYWIIRHLVK
jgi:hypothetical protein